MNIEELKHSIIDKILQLENIELLAKFNSLLGNKSAPYPTLSDAQLEMLQLSEDDIAYGRLHEDDTLDKKL